MDEVSDQLKNVNESTSAVRTSQPATYTPPSSSNILQQDVDYREKKKSK